VVEVIRRLALGLVTPEQLADSRYGRGPDGKPVITLDEQSFDALTGGSAADD
jgi:hypothetical protein